MKLGKTTGIIIGIVIAVAAVIIGAFLAYGWKDVVYLRGYAAGVVRETASQTYVEAALLKKIEEAKTDEDRAKIKELLRRQIELNWKAVELGQADGANLEGIENLKKAVEDVMKKGEQKAESGK